MKLATWNVNSLRTRLPFVLSWLEDASPDILCMQETKMKDADFPYDVFEKMGFHSVHFGFSQWNGVAILSKDQISQVTTPVIEVTFNDVIEARAIGGRTFDLDVYSLYVPNGRGVADPHFQYKLLWLDALCAAVQVGDSANRNTVLAGDFNIAPRDIDVWDITQFEGMTHVSLAERMALEKVMSGGFVDAMAHIDGGTSAFSWWDYRNGAFHKGWGMRIDLILLSAGVLPRLSGGRVDRQWRKQMSTGEKPSDHAPVVLDLL